jgi:hypothetical protein
LLLAGCSPEATREPGQSGADIRNVKAPVQMHGTIDIYHETGNIGQAIKVENTP